MDLNMNTISENIRRLRKEAEMTQKELADALGISSSNVTKYEKGQLEPSLAIIKNLCRIFNVSSDELLGINTNCKSNNLSYNFINFVINKYKLDININHISSKDKELLLNLATATSKVFLSSLINNK